MLNDVGMLAGTGKISLLSRFTHNPQSLAAFCGPNSGGEGLALWLLKGWALKDTLLHSSLAAKHFSTGSCCQVYLPWIRLFLQLTKMCLRDAGTEHIGKAGSSQSQRFWILEEGRTLQVVLMMKHHQFASVLQNSLHLAFLPTVPTYFIEQPCLVCETVWNIWPLPLVSIPPLTKV